MEIPNKVRKQLDVIYEAWDNPDYVVDYMGRYLPKKGDVFNIRHCHHIDQNRSNNQLWDLVPLSYEDHVTKIQFKNNKVFKESI